MKPDPRRMPETLADPDEADQAEHDRQRDQTLHAVAPCPPPDGMPTPMDERGPEKRRGGPRCGSLRTAERMIGGGRPARPRTRSSSSGGRGRHSSTRIRGARSGSSPSSSRASTRWRRSGRRSRSSARRARRPAIRPTSSPERSAAGSPRPASRSSPAAVPG